MYQSTFLGIKNEIIRFKKLFHVITRYFFPKKVLFIVETTYKPFLRFCQWLKSMNVEPFVEIGLSIEDKMLNNGVNF